MHYLFQERDDSFSSSLLQARLVSHQFVHRVAEVRSGVSHRIRTTPPPHRREIVGREQHLHVKINQSSLKTKRMTKGQRLYLQVTLHPDVDVSYYDRIGP